VLNSDRSLRVLVGHHRRDIRVIQVGVCCTMRRVRASDRTEVVIRTCTHVI
jgi:hypothetical protein